MDIGGELRAARQARSLTIDDIARATKISPRVLRAIESNTFDGVPRGPFMRGYLMAYAAMVGLEGDGLVRRYRDEFEPAPAVEPVVSPVDDTLDIGDIATLTRPSHILQIGVIVIVAVAYLVSQRPPAPAARTAAPDVAEVHAPATAERGAVQPAVTPASTTQGREGAVGTSGAIAQSFTIELRADGPCWVQATVDGAHAFTKIMNAGDHETLGVKNTLALRLGEPGAMSVTIDGAPGRRLGRPGLPVTVRIDSSNYRQYLAQ